MTFQYIGSLIGILVYTVYIYNGMNPTYRTGAAPSCTNNWFLHLALVLHVVLVLHLQLVLQTMRPRPVLHVGLVLQVPLVLQTMRLYSSLQGPKESSDKKS